MKTTPLKTINKYTFKYAQYKTIEEAQKYIRKNKAPDYITINNLLYTMEEYDHDGKEISYYNKRSNNRIEVITENRYKHGFKDAVLTLYENYGVYRNDIAYID